MRLNSFEMGDEIFKCVFNVYKSLSKTNRNKYYFLVVSKEVNQTTVFYYRVFQGNTERSEEHFFSEHLSPDERKNLEETLIHDFNSYQNTTPVGRGELELSDPASVVSYVVNCDKEE